MICIDDILMDIDANDNDLHLDQYDFMDGIGNDHDYSSVDNDSAIGD